MILYAMSIPFRVARGEKAFFYKQPNEMIVSMRYCAQIKKPQNSTNSTDCHRVKRCKGDGLHFEFEL